MPTRGSAIEAMPVQTMGALEAARNMLSATIRANRANGFIHGRKMFPRPHAHPCAVWDNWHREKT